MLEEKRLKEIERRVKQYIQDETIKTKGSTQNVNFFLQNANDSLDSADALFRLSTEAEKQSIFGFKSFNGFLWVVNSSYYSMFYTARAMLESIGVEIKTTMSVHAVVFDALVYYFYLNGKIQKKFIEDFAEAEAEAAELLGKQKANALIEAYLFEKEKRSRFTYDMGALVVQSKAKTSLERAQNFNMEIRKMLK